MRTARNEKEEEEEKKRKTRDALLKCYASHRINKKNQPDCLIVLNKDIRSSIDFPEETMDFYEKFSNKKKKTISF
jgi:hypothetical protein